MLSIRVCGSTTLQKSLRRLNSSLHLSRCAVFRVKHSSGHRNAHFYVRAAVNCNNRAVDGADKLKKILNGNCAEIQSELAKSSRRSKFFREVVTQLSNSSLWDSLVLISKEATSKRFITKWDINHAMDALLKAPTADFACEFATHIIRSNCVIGESTLLTIISNFSDSVSLNGSANRLTYRPLFTLLDSILKHKQRPSNLVLTSLLTVAKKSQSFEKSVKLVQLIYDKWGYSLEPDLCKSLMLDCFDEVKRSPNVKITSTCLQLAELFSEHNADYILYKNIRVACFVHLGRVEEAVQVVLAAHSSNQMLSGRTYQSLVKALRKSSLPPKHLQDILDSYVQMTEYSIESWTMVMQKMLVTADTRHIREQQLVKMLQLGLTPNHIHHKSVLSSSFEKFTRKDFISDLDSVRMDSQQFNSLVSLCGVLSYMSEYPNMWSAASGIVSKNICPVIANSRVLYNQLEGIVEDVELESALVESSPSIELNTTEAAATDVEALVTKETVTPRVSLLDYLGNPTVLYLWEKLFAELQKCHPPGPMAVHRLLSIHLDDDTISALGGTPSLYRRVSPDQIYKKVSSNQIDVDIGALGGTSSLYRRVSPDQIDKKVSSSQIDVDIGALDGTPSLYRRVSPDQLANTWQSTREFNSLLHNLSSGSFEMFVEAFKVFESRISSSEKNRCLPRDCLVPTYQTYRIYVKTLLENNRSDLVIELGLSCAGADGEKLLSKEIDSYILEEASKLLMIPISQEVHKYAKKLSPTDKQQSDQQWNDLHTIVCAQRNRGYQVNFHQLQMMLSYYVRASGSNERDNEMLQRACVLCHYYVGHSPSNHGNSVVNDFISHLCRAPDDTSATIVKLCDGNERYIKALCNSFAWEDDLVDTVLSALVGVEKFDTVMHVFECLICPRHQHCMNIAANFRFWKYYIEAFYRLSEEVEHAAAESCEEVMPVVVDTGAIHNVIERQFNLQQHRAVSLKHDQRLKSSVDVLSEARLLFQFPLVCALAKRLSSYADIHSLKAMNYLLQSCLHDHTYYCEYHEMEEFNTNYLDTIRLNKQRDEYNQRRIDSIQSHTDPYNFYSQCRSNNELPYRRLDSEVTQQDGVSTLQGNNKRQHVLKVKAGKRLLIDTFAAIDTSMHAHWSCVMDQDKHKRDNEEHVTTTSDFSLPFTPSALPTSGVSPTAPVVPVPSEEYVHELKVYEDSKVTILSIFNE